MKGLSKTWLFRIGIIAAVAVAVFVAWRSLKPEGLPEGFASSNGRIEATEIDVATKIAGRVEEILADEGDFVRAGQVLAKMDTDVLEAQRREAEAELAQAQISIATAKSLVRQREAEIAQREAERDAAQKHLARTEVLTQMGHAPEEQLDDDRAQFQAAQAAVSGAEEAQSAAAEAAIGSARSQVIDARAAVEAAKAIIQRIQADIDDSQLKSPQDGRVQYRVAEPGEVLNAGC